MLPLNRSSDSKILDSAASSKDIQKRSKSSDAKEIADILNKEKGEKYAANWTGATDKAIVKKATVIKINRGKGFETCVKCEVADAPGYYIYMPLFIIDSMPTKESIFVFKCGDAIYVQE